MFANLKELNQELINEKIHKYIKCELTKDFLLCCLQIDPEKRDNVYELLHKE